MLPRLNKTNLKALLVSLIAVFNFLTLLLPIVDAAHTTLEGVDRYFANGFTLAFDGFPVVCESMGYWLVLSSIVHFSLSLAVIVMVGTALALKRGRGLRGFGPLAVIIALCQSIVYMINGIAANSLAADFQSLYYTHYTLAPVGFVLIFLLSVTWFAVHFFMSDSE